MLNTEYLAPSSIIPEWSVLKNEYVILQNVITNENEIEAYMNVLKSTITGVLHSVLIMIDGGTALVEKFNIDLVVVETGESLRVILPCTKSL